MSWSIYKNTGGNGTGDLITPETLGAAQEHKIVIDIMPPNKVDGEPMMTIDGFSKEAFNYTVQAEYSNVVGWTDPSSLAFNILKDITQRNTAFYSGYGSKRMFNPGKAYVQLNLKFRAYDEPNIISKCDMLTKCCLPIMSRDNFMLNTNALEVGGDFVGQVARTLGTAAAETFVGGGVGDGVGVVLSDITNSVSTKMPPHLRISFGSYFKKSEMVLTNCSFTFSKEFTRSGGVTYPTYVDFDLQVESLYSSLALGSDTAKYNSADIQNRIFGPGFNSNAASGRVEIDTNKVVDEYVRDNPVANIAESISNAWGLATGTSTGEVSDGKLKKIDGQLK